MDPDPASDRLEPPISGGSRTAAGGSLAAVVLFLGAIVGGLVALIIVALVAFSERIAGNASATDQGIARILVLMLGVVIWIALFMVIKPNINISIG